VAELGGHWFLIPRWPSFDDKKRITALATLQHRYCKNRKAIQKKPSELMKKSMKGKSMRDNTGSISLGEEAISQQASNVVNFWGKDRFLESGLRMLIIQTIGMHSIKSLKHSRVVAIWSSETKSGQYR
jgi:hypothetical protein